jgi:hypothetical protein
MGDLSDLLPDLDVEQEAVSSFDPIPAGDYAVMVEDAQIVNTKNLTGKMLKLKLQVMGGKYDRRVIFDQIILRHDSEKAVTIGRQRLAQLCKGANVAGKDTAELLGKTVVAAVKIREQAGYDPQNEVKEYKAAGTVAAKPAAKAEQSDIPGVTKRTVYTSGNNGAGDDDDQIPF